MQLYCAPGTISVAIAIALEEAQLPYEAVLVDFTNAEQTKAPYHQINPKGRVPALVVEGGILTETGALLDFIAAKAPEAGLVPEDPVLAARMREVMYYLASTVHVNHAHKHRGHRWADKKSSWTDMTRKVKSNMEACCRLIETNALRGPYVLGERFCLADPYLYVVCSWLESDKVDVRDFAKIRAFREVMESRASVQAIRAAGLL